MITHGNVGDFYPRSPCGERLCWQQEQGRVAHISIHALLAESDAFYNRFKPCARYFYPRSPCGERQLCEGNRAAEPYFYPRSPCGERLQSLTYGRCVLHFYPRSPCGERLCWFEELDQFDGISIHALLAESDSCPLARPFHCHDFYPRSPCGERHSHTKVGMHQILFLSTLSLRRATIVLDLFNFHEPNFYPRSPCGERPGQRRSSCAR